MLPRVVEHLSNPGPMLRAMLLYSLGKPLFWSGVLLALLLGLPRLRREKFLLVTIALQLAFFIAAYLVTPHDVTWHVRWSWERIVTQLAAPIGFLAVVAMFGARSLPEIQRVADANPAGLDDRGVNPGAVLVDPHRRLE